MQLLKSIWLFLRIVWRVWDEYDGKVIRLSWGLSWEIASDLHRWKPSKKAI